MSGRSFILKSLFAFLVIHMNLLAKENFLLLDGNTGEILQVLGTDAEQRVSPCSTFKIALSLMGFDMGILHDEEHPIWSYKEEYVSDLPTWKCDQTPRSWMKLSCVWYSLVLAEKIGMEKIQNYVEKIQYGNQDMKGEVSPPWISSSLKISLLEQVSFLKKLVREELPFSGHAMQMTKHLLFIEELADGWRLFGKTGLCMEGRLGWFIGWIEKEGQSFIFAYNIQEPMIDPSRRIPRVKQLLLEAGIACFSSIS